jgi:type IV pilus assembly protein PilC
VRSALVYPCVVSVMAILITLVLMIKVVPVFKEMFASFDAELPMPTQILIVISDFLVNSIPIWVAALVVTGIGIKQFMKTDRGKLLFDNFKLTMPIFGMIFRKVAVSKFSRTLSTKWCAHPHFLRNRR